MVISAKYTNIRNILSGKRKPTITEQHYRFQCAGPRQCTGEWFTTVDLGTADRCDMTGVVKHCDMTDA